MNLVERRELNTGIPSKQQYPCRRSYEDVVKHNAFVLENSKYPAGMFKRCTGKENSPSFCASVYLC